MLNLQKKINIKFYFGYKTPTNLFMNVQHKLFINKGQKLTDK